MADEVLEMLTAIRGDIAGLKADMMSVITELRIHSETFDVVLQEGRMLRGAVSDSARRSVARGEVEAVHHDLNRLRNEISALRVRVDMIEERVKYRS